MAGISYIQLVNKIKSLASGYVAVKRVVSEAEDQIQNLLTETEEYFSIAVCPVETPVTFLGETSNIRVRVYCLGVIQKHRANVENLWSDATLILQDLYKDFLDGNDYEYEVISDCFVDFEDAKMVDYLAGASMELEVNVAAPTQCEIPRSEDYEA